MTAVATHLVMSFGQTLLHYKVAHHPIGGKLFRNHINFHHTHYADDHLVSRTYLGDEGNITPYFLIPIFLVGLDQLAGAPGCFSGCARAKASIIESELAIRVKFENGAVSTEKYFAPAAWLARQMSASVIASPWQ